jgi:hypothetical protein
MRTRAALAATVVSLTVAATATTSCATSTGATPAPGRPTVQAGQHAAREALALWRRFPANARPRPIVIPVGPGIVEPPASQREDLALYAARWSFSAPSAADVAAARRQHWVTPAAAIAALRSSLKHAPAPSTRLAISVRLAHASFITDRGRVDLPAWQFHFGRYRQPASVLAVVPFDAPPLRRLDPNGVGNSQDGEQAIVSADDRTLTISFTGGPAGHGPCNDSYSATAATSTRAVAFTVYEHPAPAPPNTFCAAVGYTRTVAVRLARPLGARVLVDSTDAGAIPAARHPTFAPPV